jgi:hypothetical protein
MKMKSLRLLPGIVVALCLSGVPQAIATSSATVKVTNNTAYTMVAFYASSSDSTSWDTNDNLMAGQTLAPGQQTTINIGTPTTDCTYDLMAVLNGASQYAYTYSVNPCSGGSWTISQ